MFKLQESKNFIQRIKKEPIIAVSPGDVVYVDIRFYGAEWYRQLQLPDAYSVTYVVSVHYTRWFNKSMLKIVGECAIFNNEVTTYDAYFVYAYGSIKVFDNQKMRLVDTALVKQFPQIISK